MRNRRKQWMVSLFALMAVLSVGGCYEMLYLGCVNYPSTKTSIEVDPHIGNWAIIRATETVVDDINKKASEEQKAYCSDIANKALPIPCDQLDSYGMTEWFIGPHITAFDVDEGFVEINSFSHDQDGSAGFSARVERTSDASVQVTVQGIMPYCQHPDTKDLAAKFSSLLLEEIEKGYSPAQAQTRP